MKGLQALDQKKQRLLVLSVPAAVVLLSLILLIPAWARQSTVQRKLEKRRAALGELLRTLPKPDRSREILVNNSATEPTVFVKDISSIARSAGCRFSGMNVTDKSEPVKVEGKASTGGLTARPVSVEVILVGEYRSIRRFLAGLAQAKRLYVVSGLVLRSEGMNPQRPSASLVLASVVVERYVAEASKLGKPKPPVERPTGNTLFGQ
jgi:hypothetical protein